MVILPNLSMKVLNGYPFSYRIFTNVIKVKWWGLLMTNWAPNFITKVSKESIKYSGNHVNQLKTTPFSIVGNTLHKMTSLKVYKLTNVIYMATCSSWLVLTSYFSNIGLFQLSGNNTSIIPSKKNVFLSKSCKHHGTQCFAFCVTHESHSWFWSCTWSSILTCLINKDGVFFF